MTKVGKYTLDKKLGEGTFSITYLARDEAGNKVAVKHIQKRKVKEEDWSNEIDILRLLQRNPHPHIVSCLDIVEDEENVYIVEELLPHGDLLTFLTQHSPLREADIRRLFWSVLSAVEHLHSLGIVHRDIKLENLLLSNRGKVKLIDFNLSCPFSEKTLLTRFCGSLPYCPPEMVLRTPYVGPEVDVWALGVLLYLLLFARYPFPVDDERDIACLRRFMTNLLSAQYTIPSCHPYSNEAVHLLRSFFKTDRTKRPSIETIKNHPWFKNLKEEERKKILLNDATLRLQKLSVDENVRRTHSGSRQTQAATNFIEDGSRAHTDVVADRPVQLVETSEMYVVWKPFLKNGILA